MLHPGSLVPSPEPSMSGSSTTLHNLRDGAGGLLHLAHCISYHLTPSSSPPAPSFPLLVPFFSALIFQLLTFSVTGWKGLQDQASGTQRNGDFLGPVAEQGLGKRM